MTRTPAVLTTGDTLEPRSIGPITQTDIVRFAGAGGDFNPLHHDPDYARAAGLPGVIAMGQMQAGMLAGYLSDHVGVEHLLSYSVRFASPLSIGEILILHGTVTDVTDSDARVELEARVDDRVVVSGTARVRRSH